MSARRPFEGALGVFDSGVGGLTVVRSLLRHEPDERILYLADQAHVPYGGRPLAEVRGFASAISTFLADQGCRAIVMACNISSATALAEVRAALSPIPVLGMIEPAACRATSGVLATVGAGASQGGAPRIGVLATEGTVRTCAYPHEIRRHEPSATVHQVGCPRFVPLVEAGTADSAEAADAAREYLRPLLDAGCERIILGCTHYPFLLPVLQRVAADEGHTTIEFIDPADEISAAVRAAAPYSQAPDRRAVLSSSYHGADTLAMRTGAASLLLTTGPADTLERQVPVFVPAGMCRGFRIAHARWTDGKIAPCTAL